MTPKERRDAAIELRDIALELEERKDSDSREHRAEKWRRAQFFRVVAAELAKEP